MTLWKKLIILAFGSALIAAAVNYCILPHHIVEGGMIGAGILVYYAIQMKVGTAILLLCIPIYMLTWAINKRLIFNNLLGTSLTALLINLCSVLPFTPMLTPLASAIIGGLMIGTGIGIMLLINISTDSLDLLAQLLASMLKLNVGVIILVLDLFVLVAGSLLLSKQQLLLSLIAILSVGFMTILITASRPTA